MNTEQAADCRPDSNRRQAGRMLANRLHCSRGQLQDLSATGGCFRRIGLVAPKSGQVIDLVIGNEDRMIQLNAQVMRVQRTGLVTFEIGVQFIDLNEQTKNALTQLARSTYSEVHDCSRRGERSLATTITRKAG